MSSPLTIAAPAAGWHFQLPPPPAGTWPRLDVKQLSITTMQGSLGQEVKDTTSS